MSVVYREAALEDLESIYRYSASQWGPRQARRYLEQIDALMRDIAVGKRVVRRADDIRPGLMKCRSGSHMAYVRRLQGRLVVVRILHVAMDPERHVDDGST